MRNSVSRLNQILCDRFIAAGVPVCPIHPGGHVILCEDDSFDFTSLIKRTRLVIESGFIPLVHGDVVVSDRGFARVLGGDEIMLELCKSFGSTRGLDVAFFTNVDGVLDKKGEVICNLLPGMEIPKRKGAMIDVTGGMASKVAAARSIADLGSCKVYIVRAASASSLEFLSSAALSGVATKVCGRL